MQKDGLEKALQQKVTSLLTIHMYIKRFCIQEQEKAELTAICEELMKELGDKQ